MSLDINVPSGNPNNPGFSVQRSSSGLHINAGALASTNTKFGIANDEGGLSINAQPVPVVDAGAAGWIVYIFRFSGEHAFTLYRGRSLLADILRVGGGGAGGGGIEGGGGGAGQVLDEHDVVIESGHNDGLLVVGRGGDEVAWGAVADAANIGRSTTFGGVEAYGGGYGAAEIEGTINDPFEVHRPATCPAAYYGPSDGASGGGGGPWPDPGGPGGHGTHGHDGASGYSNYSGPTFMGGGGGGAGYQGGDQTGGLYQTDQEGYQIGHSPQWGGYGVPCDITGYGPYWILFDHFFRFVPWYGGGGQGINREGEGFIERALPGCGGGGNPMGQGEPNTGGGGGGSTQYEFHDVNTTGKAGGSGVVIVRILASDEWKVASPHPLSRAWQYNPVTDRTEWVYQYPAGISVIRLDESQPHTDEPGDEARPHTHEENQ